MAPEAQMLSPNQETAEADGASFLERAMSKQCEDCDKKLVDSRSRRCRSCAKKAAHAGGAYSGMSEALKTAHARGDFKYGKPSLETCRKISESMKAAHRIFNTPEYRSRVSRGLEKAWKRGEYDNRVASCPPYKSTEVPLIAALDICGIEHKSQYRPDGYGRIYDEFVPPNILIEIHGDYFHSEEFFPGIQKRDTEKAAWAEKNGYHLIIIWEREIKEQGAWSLVHGRILPLLEAA